MEADVFIRKLINEIHNNSNYISPTFEKYMDLVIDYYSVVIPAGRSFFRARVYNEEDRYDKWRRKDNSPETVFYGYEAKGSFVNLETESSAGRCNVQGQHVLYMATDIITAIQEVCSKPGVAVSVAEIELIDDICIVDFAKDVVITSGC